MSFWEKFPPDRLLVEVSLWSADFTRLGEEIAKVDSFADLYHLDVSDGHFVPGLLFFADLVSALRPLTSKPFHVHLMCTNPLAHIADFRQAGADLISIHAENGPLVPAALQKIHQSGAAAGIAVSLETPPERIIPLLDLLDIVIMMGTPIGVKGVELSRLAYSRIRLMQHILLANGCETRIKIAADGGIRVHTVPELRANGADIVVAGSLVFKSQDLSQTFEWLHSLQTREL